jgi:hypothetical protein
MSSQPQNQNKKVIEIINSYTQRTEKLDKILTKLTKDYCADECPHEERGCCWNNHYMYGMSRDILEEMLSMQEKQARENGWTPDYDRQNCKYHTKKGCTLTSLKSPICIGHICSGLENYITDKFGIPGESFVDLMRQAKFSELKQEQYSPSKLLAHLDGIIIMGEELIEINRKTGEE